MSESVGSNDFDRVATHQRAFVFGAAAVLVLAAVMWASFVRQGAPFVYHPDEPAVMARALRIADTNELDPRWFHYPSLCIYLDAIVASVVQTLTRLPMAHGTEVLFEGARASVLPYYVAGRTLTVAFALGTALLTMLMSRRFASVWVSLIAGLTFVTSTLVLKSAVFTTVDMPLTFFVTLATLLCMHMASRKEKPRLWQCVPIVAAGSLAAGAKYNGALVLPVFAGVFLMQSRFRVGELAKLAAYGLLSVDLFLATTPYAILDWPRFWSTEAGLPAEFLHYRTGHIGADVGSSAMKALSVLYDAAGPFAIAALVSVLFLLLRRVDARRTMEAWVVLASVALLAAPVCIATVFFPRNCLPLLPGLLALGSLGIQALCDWVASRVAAPSGARRALVPAIAGALALLQARAGYAAVGPELAARRHTDPRTVAHEWAVRHLPPGSRILREAFTPHVHLVDDFVVRSVFSVGQLPLSETFDDYDYVVTGSATWQLFPDHAATPYGLLFSKPMVFEAAPPGIPGYTWFPAVRIYRTKPPEPEDLESRVVFRVSEEDGFADVLPIQDLAPTPEAPGRAGALVANATGRDPCFLLPELPGAGEHRYLLRVVVESPTDTWLQVFYATPSDRTFDEKKSIRRPIAKGENRVDVWIGPVALAGRLRLDPGEEAGRYEVRAVTLYAMPAATP
jgi:hypothetical protein